MQIGNGSSSEVALIAEEGESKIFFPIFSDFILNTLFTASL